MTAAAPTLSDEWISEHWPDQDAAEVRRRFDALMVKIGDEPYRGMPRFPDAMVPVLAFSALLPSQRVEQVALALSNVPDHFRDYLFVVGKPAFGEQRVSYENVVGDNGHGTGRQAVAITPYIKGYNIAAWIAATSPGNIAALLAERQDMLGLLRILVAEPYYTTEFIDACDAVDERYGKAPA